MFDGFFQLESTATGVVIVRTGSNAPVDADHTPTYRVYGPSGLMAGQAGSLAALDTGTITGATQNAPITVTSVGHNRVTGDRVQISGVLGNTAANGAWTIAVVDSNTFTLTGSNGNAAYTSGGTWHAAGIYAYSIDVTSANGYIAGLTYSLEISCQVGGFPFSEAHTFVVT